MNSVQLEESIHTLCQVFVMEMGRDGGEEGVDCLDAGPELLPGGEGEAVSLFFTVRDGREPSLGQQRSELCSRGHSVLIHRDVALNILKIYFKMKIPIHLINKIWISLQQVYSSICTLTVSTGVYRYN